MATGAGDLGRLLPSRLGTGPLSVSGDAMSEDTETLAKLKVLLRGWEQAEINGIPGLEADIALMRQRVHELEGGGAGASSVATNELDAAKRSMN